MDPSELCGIRWVHVFEDDTPAGAVYRPDSTEIPLSRRPRRSFTLHPDGSADLYTGGPDDRFTRRGGVWRSEGKGVVVAFPAAGHESALRFRIAEASTTRLVVADDTR